MTGKSRKVFVLAGVSLVANFALANKPNVNPAWKNTPNRNVMAENSKNARPIVDINGKGGFINLSTSEQRADGMCLINKVWVQCSELKLGGAQPNAILGTNGTNAASNGIAGSSGVLGSSGSNGTNAASAGVAGSSGVAATSGSAGVIGSSGIIGSNGTNAASNGTSGSAGVIGSSGVIGTNGTNAASNGTSGSAGVIGSSGVIGTNGTNAASSGTSGSAGVVGSAGIVGTNGTNAASSGVAGSAGIVGTNGTNAASNGTNAASNGTNAASNGTNAASNGTNAASNGTNAASNGTNAASNGTNAASNGTNAASNGTNAASNGTNAASNGTNAASNGTNAASNGTNAASHGVAGSNGITGTNGTSATHGTRGSNGTNGTYGTSTDDTGHDDGHDEDTGKEEDVGHEEDDGREEDTGKEEDVGHDEDDGREEDTGKDEDSTEEDSGDDDTGTEEDDTEDTGDSDDGTDDGFEEEEENELKAKLKPLFHLSFDYGSYIVNLTPQFRDVQPRSTLVKYDYRPMASSDALIYGDFRDGFQKTVYGSIEVGLGAQVQFWFDNATGVLDHFWAYVGVLPIVGKDTESVRYVSTLDKAYAMGGRWAVPKNASDLDTWDAGDSITYMGHGGIIFSAGAGLGPVGVGVAKLASGTWETYVEKVGSDKAYVKMSRGKLNSFSMFTNVSIVTLALSDFKYADDGFSFLFDLSTDVGRKAYEDIIRGNVLASETFAKKKPMNFVERAPVQKIETFTSVSSGRIASKSLSIPIIWDKTYSKGRINSFTTSDMHVERNTARVHYGIFSDAEDSRFWTKHKEREVMFYGAKYSVQNWDTKARMDSMFGTYSYSFRHEKSNGARLRSGMKELVKRTGLDTLMMSVPDRDLGYTGLEFNVNFSDENTARLMAAAQRMSQDAFINVATDQIYDYFRTNSDPYDLCILDRGGPCVNSVTRKTANAASKMYFALKSMYRYMNSDPKAFAAAYGAFGEGMAENHFTFRTAMKLAGPGVGVDYLIEGTYISMYFREWSINSQGRWVPALERPKYKGLPFNPATRHSRVRGMIIGNSDAGRVPHMTPVTF
ncbi:hypothetical protein [Bdellovibrio bacteriovorus]|uniref:hypothetical protein n=1 Tax=Bdellovibrio bacteriovorus TaxID=959 RepID=UPI0035A87840